RIDRKVILVIDALNEIEDRDAFPDLFWLPRMLPANLRLIVSTLPGRWLDALEKHGWPTLTVQPLTVDERRQIIARVLREAGKVLDERHVVRLAEALPTANALFLRSVLEELRAFGVRERLEEMLECYLAPRETDRTPPALHDLFARILARYEEDYERERPRLVGDAMALVWASRRGLEESDLLALLGGGGDDPLPQAYWAPLYCAAEHSLIDRAGRITIAHHAMREAVRQRYLSTAQAQRAVHARLADHFEKREAGPRKVEELPWQLARAGEYRRLSRVLADLPFLEQAWKASRVDVESYWGEIYAKAPFVVAAHAYGPVMADPVAHVEYLDPVQLLLGFLGQRADIRHMDERLVEHYRTTGDERNLARFLHDLAAELRKIGELDRAMALLHEEGAIWQKLGEEKMTAAVLDAQGMVLRRQAQFDRALALHEEAEAIARRLSEPALLGGILNNKAWVLREQGLFDDLPPLFREVESIARRNSDPWSLAHALAILADLAYKPLFRKRTYSDDDYEYFLREIHPLTEEAWQLARAGYMDIADELQTKFEEGRNFIRQYGSRLTNRGVRHYEQGELDAARDCFEAALNVYRRVDDETGIGICLGELGLVHATHGEHEPALELLRKEEVLCRRQNDLHGLHYCLSNQTLVHLERDDLAAAQKTLQTLERECASVEDDDPSAERRRLAHTATLLHRQGKPLEALEIVFRQQRLSERAGDSEGLVRALLQGATLLAETGQFTAAAMSAERASHFAKQHGFVTLQRQADDTLATVLPLAFRGGCGSWLRKLFGR
ncbi:MAG TPA: tetratricopeptide repeat protein, partial [Thermoanaerobaculia bacterium]|nr:tetratricopeptide repeat protein [Thermoanaerobaculia bacterium]